MSTPVSLREPPAGYVEEYDDTIWNVGHVFRWSEVYEAWLDCSHQITVKPGQSLAEAYDDKTVFFTS